jgi:hypothetical protein
MCLLFKPQLGRQEGTYSASGDEIVPRLATVLISSSCPLDMGGGSTLKEACLHFMTDMCPANTQTRKICP